MTSCRFKPCNVYIYSSLCFYLIKAKTKPNLNARSTQIISTSRAAILLTQERLSTKPLYYLICTIYYIIHTHITPPPN